MPENEPKSEPPADDGTQQKEDAASKANKRTIADMQKHEAPGERLKPERRSDS